MAKRMVLTLVLCMGATAAAAQARPNSLNMTCGQARQLVLSQGAVVIGTGPNIYDRYVRDGGFCLVGEYPSAGWITTRDNPQCVVGFRCRSGPPDEFGG
jgi:hypothetical protein